jgi:hypothetical protein
VPYFLVCDIMHSHVHCKWAGREAGKARLQWLCSVRCSRGAQVGIPVLTKAGTDVLILVLYSRSVGRRRVGRSMGRRS